MFGYLEVSTGDPLGHETMIKRDVIAAVPDLGATRAAI